VFRPSLVRARSPSSIRFRGRAFRTRPRSSKIGACGVCGTDLHILKGHWPKKLPWPFTLGHELGGVIVEAGSAFKEDFMSKSLQVGSKVMIPPLIERKPDIKCNGCANPDAGGRREVRRFPPLRRETASHGVLKGVVGKAIIA